ncbi:hypothetical protein [Kingella kingae]|nr:hypothetical protein [Kingella kingae]
MGGLTAGELGFGVYCATLAVFGNTGRRLPPTTTREGPYSAAF